MINFYFSRKIQFVVVFCFIAVINIVAAQSISNQAKHYVYGINVKTAKPFPETNVLGKQKLRLLFH